MSKAIWSAPQSKLVLSRAAERGFHVDVHDNEPAELYHSSNPKVKLQLNFTGGEFLRRIKTSGKHQPLTKALGLPKGLVEITDLTAGLGGDTVTLAALGCRVTAIERNPLLYLLLAEALLWAAETPELTPVVERITLIQSEALNYLESHKPKVVLYDPMYPDQDRKSLPRKEIQILWDLVGEDVDQEQVLKKALEVTTHRVVVKRPKRTKSLVREPNQTFESPTTRYDLYLTQKTP